MLKTVQTSISKLVATAAASAALLFCTPPKLAAQANYFVTYSHHMEEPGNLEFANRSVLGSPHVGNTFVGSAFEFEYGVKAWWTTELYLDGQTTFHDSTLFTGFRWENRFRPLKHEHFINPVLYIEYENISGADKIMKEIEGHDGETDHLDPNSIARHQRKHELETKLILSSNVKGWNFSENIIATKNLSNDPWEFGYALGASRPLALKEIGRAHV